MLHDAIQIGPFLIQYFLVVVLFTFLVTYYLIEALVSESDTKQFIRQHYWTVVIILVVFYKFGIVLLRTDLLLTNRWLFITAGQKGIYLGVLISIIYLLWRAKKGKFSKNVFIKSVLMITICFFVLYQLIKIVVLSFA